MSQNRLQPIVLMLLLAFIGATVAQQSPAPPQPKVMKDPAEYNAYMSAISQTDPNAKAQALETFLQQYPNTVVKEETLEQLMAVYGQAANKLMESRPTQGVLAGVVSPRGGIPGRRLIETANSLFYVNPDNLRAIAVLVYDKQAEAKFLGSFDLQQVGRLRRDAAELAKRGLRVMGNTPQPASMSNDAFAKYISGLTTLFNGALSTPPQK